MNVLLTAALVLSVIATIHGEISTSSSPKTTTVSAGQKGAEDKEKDAGAVANNKGDDKNTGKKTEAKSRKSDAETTTKMTPTISIKRGQLKKADSRPMNDSPASEKTADKKKDEAGKEKAATVTVAQDTATIENGVTSCHVTNMKLVVAIGTILTISYRI